MFVPDCHEFLVAKLAQVLDHLKMAIICSSFKDRAAVSLQIQTKVMMVARLENPNQNILHNTPCARH